MYECISFNGAIIIGCDRAGGLLFGFGHSIFVPSSFSGLPEWS